MKSATLVLALFASTVFAGDEVSVELNAVRLVDLVRVVYGDVLKRSFIVDKEIAESPDTVSLSLKRIRPADLEKQVAAIAERRGFRMRNSAGVTVVEKTPVSDEEIVVYRPRHRSASYLAEVVQGVTFARSLGSRSIKQHGVQEMAPKGMEAPTSAAGMIDRSEADQIAFSVPVADSAKVLKLLAQLDTPSGEVVLRAAVYEVGANQKQGGAIKLAGALLSGKLGVSLGNELDGGVKVKASLGGLDVVLSALDADDRFKIISRPYVRVKSGAEAKFSVGSEVPTLGAVQLDKNGNPQQSVQYRQSGVILTAKPEVRDGGIEIAITQELSSFIATTTGVNTSPTLIKRSVNTRLGIQPGEVVVLAGLQEKREDEQTNRFPFFGWNIGNASASSDSEILVFIEAEKL